MLSPEKLASLLPTKILDTSLFVFSELPSTNTFALELARKPTPQGTVVLADRQTAGRGRLKRAWFSPPEANVYGSLIFSFRGQLKDLGWAPLMAGMSLAQAIEDSTNIRINLKWPNDLLIHDQKVGGILCESFKRNSTETGVVIGFGINVNLSKSEFPKELQQQATSLSMHSQSSLDRHQLLKNIIPTLENGWNALNTEGPSSCKVGYTKRCNTLGKHILVTFPDGTAFEGMAQSIGEHGQLRVIPSASDSIGVFANIREVHAGDIQEIRKSARQKH